MVVEAKGVSKAYGDKVLYENVNFSLPEGRHRRRDRPERRRQDDDVPHDHRERKAGCGHDQDRRDGQAGIRGPGPQPGSEQIRLTRSSPKATRPLCSARPKSTPAPTVARFNFAGTDQQKKVKDISGGERNRVHLARMLKEGANLIMLDEPTNDLDVNTLRALEEALENFAGCAVIISHDRWFLDRIATHILAFEGDSKVVWFEGNYSEYEADRKKRLGKEADQPHSIRYRKLTR